ncbi:MAG TPA: ATP-binding protein, partial [Steroidobacteraceae bacterium]|nr:ATP-binding protein [Steroidobacteraceae bacterium]
MKRTTLAPIRAAPAIAGILFAIFCSLSLAPAVPAYAQSPNAIAEQIARDILTASELETAERTGKLTPDAYRQQAKNTADDLKRLAQIVGALPASVQADVRQRVNLIVRNGVAAQRAGGGPGTIPPYIPPPDAHTVSPWWVHNWWLMFFPVAAAGGGYAVWRRRRSAPRQPPVIWPAKTSPQIAPAPQARVQPASIQVAKVSQPQGSTLAPLPRTASEPSASGSGPGSGSGSAAGIATAGGSGPPTRDRVLQPVLSKYRASVTIAMDALTETQLALQQNAAVPESIRQELRRIGAALYAETHDLLRKRVLSLRQAVVDALLLRPAGRFVARHWRRRGLLAKIVIGCVILSSVPRWLLERGSLSLLILGYVIAVPVIFFLARRSQTKGAMLALEKSAAGLKSPHLMYVYANQAPSGTPGAMTVQLLRISSGSGQQAFDEIAATYQPDSTGIGGFIVSLDDLASFRRPPGGSLSLIGMQQGNALMSNYGGLVTEALMRHATELEPLYEAAGQFGDLKWRERQQSADIPRAENLLAKVAQIEKIWKPVYVADDVFEFLMRRIDLFNMRENATPSGLLLSGYAGNGKEFLARKIAESVFAQFVKPTADQLSNAQSIKDLWAAQAVVAPVVLFIDYADKIFARAGDQEGAGRDATLAWFEEWSRHEPSKTAMWVIMSAENEQNLHPRILAQFGGSKVEIKPPDVQGRELILGNAVRDNQLPSIPPRWLIETTGGTSVRDLREIVRETRMQSVPEPPTEAHWRKAAAAVLGSGMTVSEGDPWERLVLPAETKTVLKRAARILRDADLYKGKKVTVPNILLFGPPGTGKTEVARTFAKAGGVKFLPATTADMKGQYVGHSAHMVRDLFGRARQLAPCILFIDEIESAAAKRGSATADTFTQEIVTEMLAQMEGAKISDRAVIVLAATNLVDQVDPAILDRFTSRIEIALPDEPARKELLQRLIAERPAHPDLDVEEICTYLAKRLKGKSGRELVKIMDRAMERAVSASTTPDDVYLTRALILEESFPRGGRAPPTEAELGKIWEQIVLKPEVKADVLDKIRAFNRGDKAAPRGMLL